jgi:hypothetical protein
MCIKYILAHKQYEKLNLKEENRYPAESADGINNLKLLMEK